MDVEGCVYVPVVCVCVCVCVRVYVCTGWRIFICVIEYTPMCDFRYALSLCLRVCALVCAYVCAYVCVQACAYVCEAIRLCVSVLKGPLPGPDGDINSRHFGLSTQCCQRVEGEQQVD